MIQHLEDLPITNIDEKKGVHSSIVQMLLGKRSDTPIR